MDTLQEQVNQLRIAHKIKPNPSLAGISAANKRKLDNIRNEFEREFAEYLPLLKDLNIVFRAEFQDPDYQDKGTFIRFMLDKSELLMDFRDRNHYRYEYNNYLFNQDTAKTRYAAHPVEEFLIFIYDGLIA